MNYSAKSSGVSMEEQFSGDMNMNTNRNPFERIGKVIKYEFKHSARTLLPLYGVLLVLGLLTGLSVSQQKYDKIISSVVGQQSYHYELQGQEAAKAMITGLLVMAVVGLSVAIIVITIVSLARRFKQSMLGEEAYLNLSLPLTMGEQLWGRFIMDFIWIFCCVVVIFLTFLLCFMRMNLPNFFAQLRDSIPEMNEALSHQNLSFGKIIGILSLMSVAGSMWVITFIFVVNAISHLFKNQKGIVKVIAIIVLIWISGKVTGLFTMDDVSMLRDNSGYFFVRNGLIISAINFVWSAIYFAFSQYVFTKKLNLE